MSVTAAIKAAIVADLEDIDGSGIFTTNLAEVGTEPVRVDAVKSPAVYMVTGEGEDEVVALGAGRERTATQDYDLALVTQGSTPHAEMDTLLDDVRNAFMRTTSNILTLTSADYKIRDVQLVWEQAFTEEGIDEGTVTAGLTVSTAYEFTGGSV